MSTSDTNSDDTKDSMNGEQIADLRHNKFLDSEFDYSCSMAEVGNKKRSKNLNSATLRTRICALVRNGDVRSKKQSKFGSRTESPNTLTTRMEYKCYRTQTYTYQRLLKKGNSKMLCTFLMKTCAPCLCI